MTIESDIKRFLSESEEIQLPLEGPNDDIPLLASGLIDSLAVLDIIAFLETRFDVRFEPEDLTGDNFDRISSMAALVRVRMNRAAGGR